MGHLLLLIIKLITLIQSYYLLKYRGITFYVDIVSQTIGSLNERFCQIRISLNFLASLDVWVYCFYVVTNDGKIQSWILEQGTIMKLGNPILKLVKYN